VLFPKGFATAKLEGWHGVLDGVDLLRQIIGD